jgi:hypothetical protein
MELESKVESQQRWIATAEVDLRSAQRGCLIWMSLLLATVAARFCISEFAPKSWAIGADVLELVLLLIFFVKAALRASDAQDAAKFLRECRNGSAELSRSIR